MISQAQIRKILLNSLFNPKVPGPMRVILDTGNEHYFIARTMEMLRSISGSEVNTEKGRTEWQAQIQKAISLLASAIATEEDKWLARKAQKALDEGKKVPESKNPQYVQP